MQNDVVAILLLADVIQFNLLPSAVGCQNLERTVEIVVLNIGNGVGKQKVAVAVVNGAVEPCVVRISVERVNGVVLVGSLVQFYNLAVAELVEAVSRGGNVVVIAVLRVLRN